MMNWSRLSLSLLVIAAIGGIAGCGAAATAEKVPEKKDFEKSKPPPGWRGPGQPGGPPAGAAGGPPPGGPPAGK